MFVLRMVILGEYSDYGRNLLLFIYFYNFMNFFRFKFIMVVIIIVFIGGCFIFGFILVFICKCMMEENFVRFVE